MTMGAFLTIGRSDRVDGAERTIEIVKSFSVIIMYIKIHKKLFYGGLAQLARASALHAEGRGFDSHSLHKHI